MTETGVVFAINTSSGGVPKLPVVEVMVTVDGLDGDGHDNLQHHGGPDRAVSLFAIERILALQEEGHPIGAGSTGENLTLSGIDWDQVAPESMLEVGDALLEIVSFASPCRTIRDSFREEKFSRMAQKLHPGWSRVYARVLRAGLVREGDRATLTVLP